MKTLKKLLFVLSCIFLLTACEKRDEDMEAVTPQLKSANNKTEVFKNVDYEYWSPVYCDGVLVDELTGTLKADIVAHHEKGILKWYMFRWQGELTSSINEEVFVVHESDKINIPITDLTIYHLNLVGNMGSHYINSGTLNMLDWTITINKSVCPGN